jgi:hypothetical protein
MHVVVSMEAAKRIKPSIYFVDTTICNLGWVAVINSILDHRHCRPQMAEGPSNR